VERCKAIPRAPWKGGAEAPSGPRNAPRGSLSTLNYDKGNALDKPAEYDDFMHSVADARQTWGGVKSRYR